MRLDRLGGLGGGDDAHAAKCAVARDGVGRQRGRSPAPIARDDLVFFGRLVFFEAMEHRDEVDFLNDEVGFGDGGFGLAIGAFEDGRAGGVFDLRAALSAGELTLAVGEWG